MVIYRLKYKSTEEISLTYCLAESEHDYFDISQRDMITSLTHNTNTFNFSSLKQRNFTYIHTLLAHSLWLNG